MPTNNDKRISLIDLEEKQDQWIMKDEAEEDEDFRQEWVKEGIDIHQALVQEKLSDPDKERYYRILASLYLEFGRSEKMINANNRNAFSYLMKAARVSPEKGDAFYHLAFLAEKMSTGNEKWESAAFYSKEAIERGVDTEKQIKVWCLLGKAYSELGLTKDAANCFNNSKKLDEEDDFIPFRTKYTKEKDEKSTFIRLNLSGGKMNKGTIRNRMIEESNLGKYVLLDNGRRGYTLHWKESSIDLNVRSAELLKLFFEYKTGLSRDEIFHNTTGLGSRSRQPGAVKTEIARLRSIIKGGLGVNGKCLIQTVGERGNQKYMWNPHIEHRMLDL
ncbi:hypothetical protein QGM71_20775 [Virgibacillus sp. C22-A2]|uniref:Tetratricopeptide repeat protein n=1 Tax=Virgibacillus tibetensis TaxID=3042313 RepID=A0ABU6KKT0_9BACI|nr:hypothetical protein [Virgibacillus sp. C22-A2]